MARMSISMAALAAVFIIGSNCDAGGGDMAAPRLGGCASQTAADGELRIDAACFFDILIDRYRRMTTYRDIAEVIQITRRLGEEPSRVETRIGCEVENGELRVDTPSSQVRRAVGLDLPFRMSEAMEDAARAHDLWLAPHMALRFAEEPLKLRRGVDGDYAPAEAEPVTIDDKPLVHLELTSGDDSKASGRATVDIYVDPESLLVERIRSWQRLPDGAGYETMVDITPLQVEPLRPGEIDEVSAGFAGEADAAMKFDGGGGSEGVIDEPVFISPEVTPVVSEEPILPWSRNPVPISPEESTGLEATPYSPLAVGVEKLPLPVTESGPRVPAAETGSKGVSEPTTALVAERPAPASEPKGEPRDVPREEPTTHDEPSDPPAPAAVDPSEEKEAPIPPAMEPAQGEEPPGAGRMGDAVWNDEF